MSALRIPLLLLFLLVSTFAVAQGNGGGKPKSVKTDEVYYLVPDSDETGSPSGGGGIQPLAPPPGGGGSGPDPYHETYARQNIREDLTPYGVDLLGEQFDLATGTLSFNHTDVVLPGNNGLEVAIRRTVNTAQGRFYPNNEFGDWELDVPKLEMTVSSEASGWWQSDRCTGWSDPGDIYYFGTWFYNYEYWNGLKMHIPGQGAQTVLDNPTAPLKTGGNVEKSTSQYWDIECGNIGGSETFIATSPNGIKYHFTKLRYLSATGVLKNYKVMGRKRAQMLVTKVEDRFGNTVNYNYTGSQLTSIVASDGRTITINYGTNGQISTVTANGRTWTYGYTTYTGYNWEFLTSVTQPDGASWSFDLHEMILATTYPGLYLQCGYPRTTATGTVTHPYGAKGTYTITETAHGRTEVPKQTNLKAPNCNEPYHVQRSFDVLSLTQKQLEGAGLTTMTWDYTYSENPGGWAGDGTSPLKTTRVDNPDGTYDIHTFNRSYTYLEGAEVQRKTYSATGALLQTVDYDYETGPYRGVTGELFYENLAKNQTPQHRNAVVTTRGTDVYTTLYDFNTNVASPTFSFGHPIEIDQSNNFSSYLRVEDIAYLHDKTNWELGRETTRDVGTETISENEYDSNNRVWKQKQYGVEVAEFSYNTDGTVAWQEDALDNRTTLASWKRGIPQSITYPDTTTHAFVVDDNGWIDSSTDAKGYATAYGWDDMGRLDLVDYPDDPGLTRVNKTLDLIKVTVPNDGLSGSGIAIGQYKHVKTRGDLTVTTYLDALFRPVLTRTQDTTDSSLDRFTRSTFDHNGQVTFASFPSGTVTASDGTSTSFDALGRTTQVAENVLPYATTSTSYLNGNKVQVTNPRGKVTTTTYFALGAPDQSLPTLIDQPESVTTTIVRNNFGEMTSATQSGTNPTVSATRSYFYDSSQRLCRQVDPETGSTAYSHNNANQLEWYALAASGSTTSCDLASVPANEKIVHTYNNMGQLTNVNYPDSSPDLTYGFDDNGNLTSLTSFDASWSYTHNAVNALDSETLVTGTQTFSLSYRFDTMDRLDQITYPGSTVVAITPNAYGEPESIGSYATDIDYWPNGSIKELDYGTQQGSSRKYTTTQNARQLPENLKVVLGAATLADLTHSYDPNANITSITDAENGTGFDRSMGYDDIDRLTSASGFWGTGNYSFDALGNILTKTESGIDLDYTYSPTTNLLTSIDDTVGSADYTFSHDAYGNVTNNGNQGFTYSLAGNMVSSTNPGISYKYDGHKRRVQKDDGSQIGYTVYGQNGKLMHKLKGGVSTHYIYAGSLLIAELQGSTVNYLHADLLGSPIKGDNGTAYSEHYRPWGEKRDHPVQLADDVGYTGHQSDVATGLTYMQARYYDPVVGRFMATDPVGFTPDNPMSFNRFLYVNGNPYKYNDPDGQFLNFAVKFVADVALNVAVNYVTTGEANVSGALKESALGVLNPAKSVQKARVLVKALNKSDEARDANRARGAAQRASCCFVAGTLVDTEDGLRPIEDIEVGDKVWARNVDTGETELKPVTDLIRRHERQIWIVDLKSEDGATSRFEATDDHPWWIPEQGWIGTAELRVGMAATTKNYRDTTITAVERTDRLDATYNLTVADFETYFVGEILVLVHNCVVHGNDKRSMKTQHRYEVADETGDVKKTGISGEPLNKNGTSPRANRQVNEANRANDGHTYTATVEENDIPGRRVALDAEQQATNRLDAAGHSLDWQSRPTPD
ncbi:MAG: polymorphic toxin-type HINT domain-containing protein [Gammaproteobacteria bacterium]|nr:polymorphic toxin-type HINT domain-containing protein [Gammaproteobacteria bacterium]